LVTAARKFKGKKLLLLGTNLGTCDIVNYAKSQGAYVIVTDNLPPEKSAAKLIADEAWQVSTADVDSLEQLAIQNQVNGIFAGVSEFNLEKALTLCERLGLPFYCTRHQWDICSNKHSFKQLCRENDVPVPREYKIDNNYTEEDLKQIRYPVIVKPVDRSAGAGIHVCNNRDEVLKAHNQAIAQSKTNYAIVEQFINGEEFHATYIIKDNKFTLLYVLGRYVDREQTDTMPLPRAVILPSNNTDKYVKELNAKVINMFRSIGLANGVLGVQGMVNNEGFYLFEPNYRIEAGLWYHFTNKIIGINYMEMMVDYALNGKMEGFDLRLDNLRINKICCIFRMISKGGVVGKITGLEEIQNKESLFLLDKLYDTGDYIEKSGTLRQVHLQFYLIEDTIQELKNSIKEIQETVKVLDDKCNDMLLPPFNAERI
jgi:biotin carboxylase